MGTLRVEEAFRGVNYLEALASQEKENLTTYLSEQNKKSGGSVISADTDSIFNKFSIFKYSNFINGSVYQPDGHFIGFRGDSKNFATNQGNSSIMSGLENKINRATADKAAISSDLNKTEFQAQTATYDNIINEATSVRETYKRRANFYEANNSIAIANPTARKIIDWGSTQSMNSVTGFQPYALSDFMFCKNYGKIPNNRLITLRRYPFPIEDILRRDNNKNPIPIAQAVTWFGEGTDNVLSTIGNLNWGLRWETLQINEEQTLEGNEVTVNDIIQVFSGIPKYKQLSDAVLATYVGIGGKDPQLAQLTGYEKKLQDYARKLYTTDGPYWNRIFGPVNVVNATTRRARGMQDGWNNKFAINFHYSFRSFNGLSPKIVALDLISSFLNLTYNDAQFLGQLARYFPRLGVKFDSTLTQEIGQILTDYGSDFAGNIEEMMKRLKPILDAAKVAASESITSLINGVTDTQGLKDTATDVGQAITASMLGKAIPELISIKSALSDRPIGEWHIVVGNPMNPILVMGDLVVSNCTMKWDEEMGPDDFPTGCTFAVQLHQGKPRDKAAIERMFNLGETKMMFSQLRNPSSADDTFGDVNNNNVSKMNSTNTNDKSGAALTDDDKKRIELDLGTGSFDKYRSRVRKSYGYTPSDNGQTNSQNIQVGTMDDSLLWLYFDKQMAKT